MTVIKNQKSNTYEVRTYYKDWTGVRKQKTKRGFKRKCDAQEWERAFKLKLSKGESLDSDMNVQEPVNVIYQTIISVKSLCFSSIVISTDALAYIILGHEEKNTMTFLSD